MRNSNLCPVRFTRSPLQMLNAYFVRAQCQAAGGRKGTKIVFLLSFRFLLGPCLSTIWKNGKGVVSLGPSRGLKGAAVGDPSGETLELEDLLEQLPPYLRDLSSNDDNVLVWNMLLLPVVVYVKGLWTNSFKSSQSNEHNNRNFGLKRTSLLQTGSYQVHQRR
ncbi:ubiquitin/ISG15-conjugating enzyme E2 L6 isoform X3 [Alexandromys fortis]|uniref:ubiquitin/ISG15-conjugating enzyme E2 L6 isoform X3 n=1 Tax=Alexandromys fortis TaxID=100897 RepID=UPI002152A973|nr:ubiquitin/ISG15-conjugating enzyme E2 L6 isoform X3 [Microtus fortis]